MNGNSGIGFSQQFSPEMSEAIERFIANPSEDSASFFKEVKNADLINQIVDRVLHSGRATSEHIHYLQEMYTVNESSRGTLRSDAVQEMFKERLGSSVQKEITTLDLAESLTHDQVKNALLDAFEKNPQGIENMTVRNLEHLEYLRVSPLQINKLFVDLSSHERTIDDQVVQEVCDNHGSQIEALGIPDYNSITERGIRLLDASCPNLKRLVIGSGLTKSNSPSLTTSWGEEKLSRVQRLVVAGALVSSLELQRLCAVCPNLKELVFTYEDMGAGMSDFGFSNFAFPYLEKLSVREADDHVLQQFSSTSPQLRELEVSGRSVTLEGCNFPYLEKLHLYGTRITRETEQELQRHSPNLKITK